MGKENLKSKNGTMTATYSLGRFERINQEELKVLVNGKIRGLVPVEIVTKRRSAVLKIELVQVIPLDSYFQTAMTFETALSLIMSTLRIACECEHYGLRADNLCWDCAHIFVDTAGEVRMIYWPVTTLDQSGSSPLRFYRMFCDVLSQNCESATIYNQYTRYFYQREHFELHLFHQLMQNICEMWYDDRQKEKVPPRKKDDVLRPDASYVICSGWLERQGKPGTIPLKKDKVRIGRDPGSCNVALVGHAGVSREHAVIEIVGSQYFIRDLGSKNGTILQGRRMEPNVQILLHDGDQIRIHDVIFLFRQEQLDKTIPIHKIR